MTDLECGSMNDLASSMPKVVMVNSGASREEQADSTEAVFLASRSQRYIGIFLEKKRKKQNEKQKA